MDNLGELAKHKGLMILAGGVAIAALLIFFRGSSTSSSGGIDTSSYATALSANIAADSLGTQQDVAALQFNSQVAGLNASLLSQNMANDATVTAQTINNGSSLAGAVAATAASSSQFLSTMLNDTTARDIAGINANGQVAIAGIAGNTADYAATTQQHIAEVDASAQASIAQISAQAGIANNFISTGGSVANTAIKTYGGGGGGSGSGLAMAALAA